MNKTLFERELEKNLKDPEFKKYYDYYGRQLEIAIQINRLRKQEKMTQTELAKKLKTSQSAVARMLAGEQNFSTEMLERIAEVFGKELKITFV
ncbi:helix-turn-helix transcriptional regulator [Patescibacteria group bacterium]|nr:helix-turn-helix transcriptional regulator [Patescibacteria group bacterium]